MDDLLSIRVTVADRVFPLRIKREDEENIRKAAKTNPALQDALDRAIVIYQLSKTHE